VRNRRGVVYYAILLLLILGELLGERNYIIIIFLEYDKGFWILGWYQDQSSGHRYLEMFEGFPFLGIPVPGLVRMSEVKEGSGYSWEILDEVIVKVNEAYESLHISPVLQGGPIADSGYQWLT